MSTRELRDLPKAHLHLHLDGSMRPETLRELAAAAGVEAPLPTSYGSFAAFTDTITAAAGCLRGPAEAERLVTEIVEDAAAAGAVWVEPSMWPGLFGGRLGSDDDVLDVVLAAGHRAAERTGTGFGLVVAANRDYGPDAAAAVAELAVARAVDGVVGFGIDGDELAAPITEFANAGAIAREGGLLVVPHAGEIAGTEAVRQALDLMRPDRIMHGVRAVEEPELVDRLAAGHTPLDVCPTSNLKLSVVPSLEEHPLPGLLERGVACSINADDSLLFDTGLLAEYEVARHRLGLADERLADCARTSLRASGAPADLVARALAGVDAWLAGSA